MLFSHIIQPPQWQSKPYLPSYLPVYSKNVKIMIALILEKQAANKALLHRIQGDILLYQLKGRTVNAFQQVREGKRLKGHQAA